MRSKALLAKSILLRTDVLGPGLPVRVADLDGYELASHCSCCGRHFRLYPGHADFDTRTKLASLLDRLVCGARRNGKACGGTPRRLLLVRGDQQWTLEASGEWLEEDSAFWEPADFEKPAARQATF